MRTIAALLFATVALCLSSMSVGYNYGKRDGEDRILKQIQSAKGGLACEICNAIEKNK